MQEPNPYAVPPSLDSIASSPGAPTSRRFRWLVIPLTLCGFFGGVFLVGNLVIAALMAYVYSRFGWSPERPDTPSLNQIAPTHSNVARVAFRLGVGVLLLWAFVVMRRRMRPAGP
jgi:hypothetical protein